MIYVLTDVAVGGTFLTWSIHFLAGHTQYFLLEQHAELSLTSNPICKNTAHHFIANQPNRLYNCDPNNFKNFVNTLSASPTSNFHIIYYHPFTNPETTKTAADHASEHADKLIVVDSSRVSLYHCSYRRRGSFRIGFDQSITNDKKFQEYYIDKYFQKSKSEWGSTLTNIWDLREFIALNYFPLKIDTIYSDVNPTRQHYLIDAQELWSNFDNTITHLFDYLNLTIDQQKLIHWQQIYTKWKSIHCQRVLFLTYFEKIIQGIIYNHNMDLTRFDLDIDQEALIQHVLIHKYNLNLKTWQLDKFSNTSQLHNLLEPNIHPVSR